MGSLGYKVKVLHDKGVENAALVLNPVVIDPSNPLCNAPAFGSRLEPPNGKVLFGFHIDWALTTPTKLREVVDFTPAVINAFLKMDHTAEPAVNYPIFEWHAQQVKRTGGMLAITIEPSNLNLISDKMIDDLAKMCYLVNSKYGVPLFLRFAHEMNGLNEINCR